MDRHTRIVAAQWLARGASAVIVEVIEAKGSVPRERGTRMLVSATQCIGTIGGGHLELKALQTAREMLRSGELTVQDEHYALGPSLGQCCGGAVTLSFASLDVAALNRWPEPKPMFHLQLYGAGHVGRAIATLLATLNASVDWIDERDAEFPSALGTAEWPSHVRKICVDDIDAEVPHAPPGASYLVLTHSHDLDLRITEAILRRADFHFLGLIGSKTKRERFAHRFEDRGIAPELIARITCPIGVDGIVGKEPELIAVAAVAQLLIACGHA
jgi:xanthine dehydrogenase accessory factor